MWYSSTLRSRAGSLLQRFQLARRQVVEGLVDGREERVGTVAAQHLIEAGGRERPRASPDGFRCSDALGDRGQGGYSHVCISFAVLYSVQVPAQRALSQSSMFPVSFPVTKKWPPRHPDRIQLYSLPTPNGVKVSIALEELGLPYEPHLCRSTATTRCRPNSSRSIPTTRSPRSSTRTARRKPLALFESGAILFYLAEKTGR
jgi:hypothetical protein